MKKSICIIMIFLLTITALMGCNLQGNASDTAQKNDVPALLAPIDVPINTAEVTYRDIAIYSYFEATAVPYVEEYSFPISGSIAAQHYSIGDQVYAGDLLAELDHTSIDSRIAVLEEKISSETEAITLLNEKYKLKIKDLKSNRELLSKSSASDSIGKIAVIDCDIEIYETKIKQNEENLAKKLEPLTLELNELKEEYPNYFIYAPMTGTVVYAESENKNVNSRATVIAIADLTTKYLQTSSIDESLIQSALRIYALYGEEEYRLRYIPYVHDSSSGRLINASGRFSNFTLSDTNVPDTIFNFGDTALLIIETDYISNVLSIPNTSINTDDTGTYVYTVNSNGAKTRQDIIVGTTNSIYTAVVDGLKEGDLVYVPN